MAQVAVQRVKDCVLLVTMPKSLSSYSVALSFDGRCVSLSVERDAHNISEQPASGELGILLRCSEGIPGPSFPWDHRQVFCRSSSKGKGWPCMDLFAPTKTAEA